MFKQYFSKKRASIFENSFEPKLSRFVFTDDPDWQCTPHTHAAETELLFITQGQTIYTIESVNYLAQEGDMIIIERGLLHALTPVPNTPTKTWTCAIQNYKFIDLEQERMMANNTYPVMPAGPYLALVNNLFNDINLARTINDSTALWICHSLAATLSVIYHDRFKQAKIQPVQQKKYSFVESILIYLDKNYTQQITLKKLSEQFRVSPSYISHMFTKEFNISPINYVIQRRINEAKFFLTNSQHNLEMIAQLVGYDNKDYFSKLFFKYVGYTLSGYRQKFKNTNHLISRL